MARIVGFRSSHDSGRFLENTVFLELKRRYKDEIYYYHHNQFECDFVIRQGVQIIQVIQVTVHLDAPQTRERELKGLLDAMTAYQLSEGLILTEDIEAEEIVKKNGQTYRIQMIPVWKWLLQ